MMDHHRNWLDHPPRHRRRTPAGAALDVLTGAAIIAVLLCIGRLLGIVALAWIGGS